MFLQILWCIRWRHRNLNELISSKFLDFSHLFELKIQLKTSNFLPTRVKMKKRKILLCYLQLQFDVFNLSRCVYTLVWRQVYGSQMQLSMCSIWFICKTFRFICLLDVRKNIFVITVLIDVGIWLDLMVLRGVFWRKI